MINNLANPSRDIRVYQYPSVIFNKFVMTETRNHTFVTQYLKNKIAQYYYHTMGDYYGVGAMMRVPRKLKKKIFTKQLNLLKQHENQNKNYSKNP